MDYLFLNFLEMMKHYLLVHKWNKDSMEWLNVLIRIDWKLMGYLTSNIKKILNLETNFLVK